MPLLVVLIVVLLAVLLAVLLVVVRVVLDVATLCRRAAHVGLAHASGRSNPETAGFAKMSYHSNLEMTTARARW